VDNTVITLRERLEDALDFATEGLKRSIASLQIEVANLTRGKQEAEATAELFQKEAIEQQKIAQEHYGCRMKAEAKLSEALHGPAKVSAFMRAMMAEVPMPRPTDFSRQIAELAKKHGFTLEVDDFLPSVWVRKDTFTSEEIGTVTAKTVVSGLACYSIQAYAALFEASEAANIAKLLVGIADAYEAKLKAERRRADIREGAYNRVVGELNDLKDRIREVANG
jgi:hypothetical protein